jgi:hypothetical protein
MKPAWFIAGLLALAAACKTESARRAEVAACSETSADALEIELCLSGNYGWKEAEARPVAATRARQLATVRTRSEDSAWAANDAQHRADIRQCGDEELSRCLLVRFGWPERRAIAASDSVWKASGPERRREVQSCVAQVQTGALVGPCLRLRYKWPSQRALALDDSLARERMR